MITGSPTLPSSEEMIGAFYSLSNAQRTKCANDCDLVEPEDSLRQPSVMYAIWFDRARKRNLLAIFWITIQAAKKEAE